MEHTVATQPPAPTVASSRTHAGHINLGDKHTPMTAPSCNTLWGRAIAAELARSSVRTVMISPGSRSTAIPW